MDESLRGRVEHELCEEQKVSGKDEGPLMEKQGNKALGFVYLEKALEAVPRKMAMITLRWMGTPETE